MRLSIYFQLGWAKLLLVGLVWLASQQGGWTAPGERSAFYEGFEGPEVSWQQGRTDTPCRMEFHGRIQGEAHVGQGCERVRLVAGHGSYVYLAHPIGRARVIDELMVSLWVKSDRAGIQLLAEVVFPRSRHPRTGEPLTALIAGSTYSQVGRWEQLRLQDVPQQVARQARVLRSQYGPQVDEREAYISHVLLNCYGGPGVTNLWIDDLDVAGFIEAGPAGEALASSPGGVPAGSVGPSGPPLGTPLSIPRPGEGPPEEEKLSTFGPPGLANQTAPHLEGSVFMVGGREFFPRIIQYRGESLALLQNLGFNVVWLSVVPGPELIGQAERLGLWLIAPPPISHEASGVEGTPQVQGIREKIPQEFDRVLAWDVTLEPVSTQLESIGRWVERVRRADSRTSRPLLCRADSDYKPLSRMVDILWLTRHPLGSSLELADYAKWLRERELLVRPGTPLWVSIPSQVPWAVRSQWRVIAPSQEVPESFSSEQMRLALFTALGAGMRGVVYESDRSLDGNDLETQTRAASLELLNRETEILEPWLAAGSGLGPIKTGQKNMEASLLRTERARLALVFWSAPAAQCVVGQAAAPKITLTLPGLSEAHEAYQILSGTLRPLRRDRIPGGVQVSLDEFDLTAMVVLTQDPFVISATTRRAQSAQRRLAELHQQLAARKFDEIQNLFNRLSSGLGETDKEALSSAAATGNPLKLAREQLALSIQRLHTQEYMSAQLAAQRANRALRLLERNVWESAGAGGDAPGMWPLAGYFRMLPEHLHMVRQVRYSVLGPNLLPAGDFEDLQAMLAAGWRTGQSVSESAAGGAELAQESARTGRFGLRLMGFPRDAQSPPEVVEAPPVWVISPPIAVEAGQCLCIAGWVRVPQTIQGGVDGLLIADSLGGETLAWRIRQTSEWQPFQMYRLVPQTGTLRVSFVLTGLGEAWLDDITIQPVQPVVAPVARALENPSL